MLIACSAPEPSSSSASSEPESSSQVFESQYVNFVDKGKVRIDLFDTDVHISYGNAALSQPNNDADLKNDSNFSLNKNSDKKYHVVLFAEKETQHNVKYYGIIDGDKLIDFIASDVLKIIFSEYDYKRGYVAFSTGDAAQWKKGLNTKLDAEFDIVIPKK